MPAVRFACGALCCHYPARPCMAGWHAGHLSCRAANAVVAACCGLLPIPSAVLLPPTVRKALAAGLFINAAKLTDELTVKLSGEGLPQRTWRAHELGSRGCHPCAAGPAEVWLNACPPCWCPVHAQPRLG